MSAQPMNVVDGLVCPPVICQRQGPAFRFHDGVAWREAEALPPAVAASLPAVEAERCERHAWRRMGAGRAA